MGLKEQFVVYMAMCRGKKKDEKNEELWFKSAKKIKNTDFNVEHIHKMIDESKKGGSYDDNTIRAYYRWLGGELSEASREKEKLEAIEQELGYNPGEVISEALKAKKAELETKIEELRHLEELICDENNASVEKQASEVVRGQVFARTLQTQKDLDVVNKQIEAFETQTKLPIHAKEILKEARRDAYIKRLKK